jgi:Integrase core domain
VVAAVRSAAAAKSRRRSADAAAEAGAAAANSAGAGGADPGLPGALPPLGGPEVGRAAAARGMDGVACDDRPRLDSAAEEGPTDGAAGGASRVVEAASPEPAQTPLRAADAVGLRCALAGGPRPDRHDADYAVPGVPAGAHHSSGRVSRKDVVAAYKRGNSSAAEHFLRHELPRMGFAVRALQIDGGSEFKAKFERACQALGIALFVLPPRSPRLNGKVERAHRTHQEEFYEIVEVPDDLVAHNALLREHEAVYNGVRPHQALGYLTPNEFVAR